MRARKGRVVIMHARKQRTLSATARRLCVGVKI
jgi:hypothetical protein